MVDYRDFRLSRLNEPRFSHLKLLLFWPFYGLFFYAIEWLVPGRTYHVMWCPLDDRIPFQELFLIPYVVWYLFMVGAHAYTLFYDVRAFRRLMYDILLTFGMTCVIFVVFPTCQQLRPESFARDNVLTRFMGWFYENMDTNTNVCPSLHVCGSFAAAAAFSDTERFGTRRWKIFHYGLAVLISISTVFVKQHSVIDVAAGLAMSIVAHTLVYAVPRRIANMAECIP